MKYENFLVEREIEMWEPDWERFYQRNRCPQFGPQMKLRLCNQDFRKFRLSEKETIFFLQQFYVTFLKGYIIITFPCLLYYPKLILIVIIYVNCVF